ncbi:MAG TPA: hypothetical protein VND45_16740 [Thermoanaerobaculia bacterium]|nr:hypothetical protein [Thermoanaerobaculia bacterium]
MNPLQRRILIALSVLIAATRLLAVARSLNDWDEALFSLGVAEYDVTHHWPHPPGYPLFIAAAKAVHLFGVNEFRSLQTIVLLGAFFLFPALFFLAREIGFDYATSICGALLFSFLPNVWVYGGTGFSDVPSIVLGLTACALLLAGRRSRRAFLLGAIVLGIAGGFRIPNLIIGAVPALIATWHRLRARDFGAVIAAMLLGGAIAGGSYLGAALASDTLENYRAVVKVQQQYVHDVDSWHNPGRPPLRDAAKTFFLWPIQQQQHMTGLTAFAILGLLAAAIARRWRLLLPLAIFGPLMITSWLNLDIEAAGRYAIAYMAVHALFAAHALRVIGRRPAIQAALATAIALVFAIWLWPGLTLQRTTEPPPAAALLWVTRNVPKGSAVYVHGAFGPHARYLLPDYQTSFYEQIEKIAQVSSDAWAVEPAVVESAPRTFLWPHTNPLWKVIRRRNFETSVVRLATVVQFGNGWYSSEGSTSEIFRWMGHESFALLPAIPNGGALSMRMYVPIDTIPPPAIEVWMNGKLVERFIGSTATIEKSWRLPSRTDGPNELRIRTSGVAVPAKVRASDDTRELGLRMDGLSWMPLR